jgi:hypothetical protein
MLQFIIEQRTELDDRPPFNKKDYIGGVSVDGKVAEGMGSESGIYLNVEGGC